LYASGAWLKNNKIPGDQTSWGSFNELQENNIKKLHDLLDAAANKKDAAAGSKEQKVGDFYRSGMDSATIEKAGITPLNAHLERIKAIKDANGVLSEVALEQTMGVGSLFGFGISPDDKNVTKEICQFGQGGLGLPDRDYYFDKDERTTMIRNAYQEYIPKIFMLMGEDEATAKKDGADVFKLETTLAGASMNQIDMRDPQKLYNKLTLEELNKMTPGMDWKTLLQNLKVSGQDTCIVGMPKYFEEVAKQLKATPVAVWQKYLSFHLVNDMSSFLSSNFDNTHFDFYGKTIRGQQQQKARWKRVLRMVDGNIGELLGQMYVEKHFTPEAKKRMLELVNNLQGTFADRIKALDWMSEATKQKALGKLNTFMKKIGYTDKWKDYSKLAIVGNDYVKNIMAASAFEYEFELSKLGRPVDRTEWGMTPPTVNAYYNPGFNEIVFPAGILQFPFFDADADDAVNYGGIGAVIGHEMTHGFDDQGCQYDADGNLHNWWMPEDSAKFVQKADMVVKQFDSYIAFDTTHVKGKLTEGENLADLGGLNIAFQAFKKTKQGQGTDKIDGFTPDQRFFLSWAQVWRTNYTPQALALQVKTNPHSPSEFRCNGPLSNMPEFYKAFSVNAGDKMIRPETERATVW
jgi:putative endopeptidase